MGNEPTETIRSDPRRRSIVPCHRLVGAGFTALVFFTPTGFHTTGAATGADAPNEAVVHVAGFPLGVPPTVGTGTEAATPPGVADESSSPAAAPESTESAVTRSLRSATSRVVVLPETSAPTGIVALAPLTSPDVGDACAPSLDSDGLGEFMSGGIDDIGGADYQRAIRLPDDRVLWTFQDAFVRGRLLHNVAAIQSGRCFTRIGPDDRPWLFADATQRMRRWHWILDGVVSADGSTVELFVVEMRETGDRYLSRTRPVALRRVSVDTATLEVVGSVDEPWIDDRLYGWSVTSDAEHTYLYSHCYQQFGYDTLLGFGDCAADVTVARVARGEPGGDRTYWDGTAWNPEPGSAVPIVDATLFFAGNNPAQIRFTGERFELVEKRGDWFGDTIEFATSDEPFGPFEPAGSVTEPLPCSRSVCNSYFAMWIPWRSSDGTAIWAISHNRWDGTETADHLHHYRPSVHSVALPG